MVNKQIFHVKSKDAFRGFKIIYLYHYFSGQVFTLEGELVLKFGSNGEGNGQFNAPTGVAVDINGNIIVADWGNSRIQVKRLYMVKLLYISPTV